MFTRLMVGAGVAVLLSTTASLVAQENDEQERDLRERVELLEREADALHERGRTDAAERTRAEARELASRIERAMGGDPELVEILEGLEHGMVALQRLGRERELAILSEVAEDVRAERDARRTRRGAMEGDRRGDRDILRGQLETLRLAMPAIRESGRAGAVKSMERAIHARELAMEGRTGRSQGAPLLGETIELLVFAEQVFRDYGDEERAHQISRMTEEFFAQPERTRVGRTESDESERRSDSELKRVDLEAMRVGLQALREAGRERAAEVAHRAIRGLAFELERMRGPEADHVRSQRPSLSDQIEVFTLASRLWRDFGNLAHADFVGELAARLRQQLRGDPGEQRDRADLDSLMQHIRALEQELERVRAEIREMQRPR